MNTNQRKWKRRLILLSTLLVILGSVFAYLIFTRFHFSSQSMWPLPQLQWGHQEYVEREELRPQIIGHRGSGLKLVNSDEVIGNTRKAIAGGILSGADWIEVDVRLSGGINPELVVFHDKRVNKKTTGKGSVSQLSVAELKDLWTHTEPQERILTLEEMFQEFHGVSKDRNEKWIFDIKVKGIHLQVLDWLNRRVEAGALSKDQIIIFGSYDILTDYKDSGYALGCTVIWSDFSNRARALFRPAEIIERCQRNNSNYLVLSVNFASESLVNAAIDNGLEVWVYGVGDQCELKYLHQCGVVGFIVDEPKRFLR